MGPRRDKGYTPLATALCAVVPRSGFDRDSGAPSVIAAALPLDDRDNLTQEALCGKDTEDLLAGRLEAGLQPVSVRAHDESAFPQFGGRRLC